MTKSLFIIALGLLAAPSVFSIESSQLRLQSTRLESAVARKELFVNFDKDMYLTQSGNSEFAMKRFEQSIDVKNSSGQTDRQIIVKCDLTQETKAKKIALATTTQDGPWTVTKIEKVGASVQQWNLSRKKQSIKMTCVALEKFNEKLEVTAMNAYLIDRVLHENNSPVSEKIKLAGDARSE